MRWSSVQQDAGEHEIEEDDHDDGIDHGFRDGTADAPRTAAGDHSLVAGNNPDDPREAKALEHAVNDLLGADEVRHGAKEHLKGNVDFRGERGDHGTAEPTDEN